MISEDLKNNSKQLHSKQILYLDRYLNNFGISFDDIRSVDFMAFNTKTFRVSDTELTYKQINSLGVSGLLDDRREKINGWRKFSFKELVYLEIIKELKKYGFSDKNFDSLKNSFFSSEFSDQTDLAFACAYGEAITIIFDNKFDVRFYSFVDLVAENNRAISFVSINLSEMLDVVFKRIHSEGTGYKTSYDKILDSIENDKILGNEFITASEKEKKLLDFIRSNSYQVITVKKNPDGKFIVKCQSIENLSENDVSAILKSKDFVNVSMVKRDGKISNINVEEIFKV